MGSEGPGRVSTEACLPCPRCPGLGGDTARCPPGSQGAGHTDPESPPLGLSHLPRACHVQMGVSEADSDSRLLSGPLGRVRPPGGPRPRSIRPKQLTSPWTSGSRLRDARRRGSACSAYLAHHLAVSGSHPPSQDHQEAELRAAQALGLIIKGTCCLDSLAGCDRSGFASVSLSVPGRLLVLYPSPRPRFR